MTDPAALVALCSAGTGAVALLSAAGLKAWRSWLELRRAALGAAGPPDVGELRARVRRLEAIAAGIEL